jgi:signal transduction histidine kinase
MEGRTATVLLVEDDREVRTLLAEKLVREGFECIACESAEEALERFDQGGIDLVLSDVHLPGKDGVALTGEIKERVGDSHFLPVILVAGRDETTERVRGFRGGCDDFMGKPVNLFELVARMGSLLARRAQNEALASANEKLRELHDKKKRLAALVVHDLRNPLSALQGNVELLREEVGDSTPFALEILNDLRVLASQALSMVASLLDVEELEEGILQAATSRVKVADFVHRAAANHWSTVRARGLSLEFDIHSDLYASLDTDLIGRLVENLLDNAVRYAPRKGRVKVTADEEDGSLVVRVGNNGPPVPPVEAGKIFGRYYRIEARRAGARANRGLGLYFCKLAAEAHGGSIRLEETEELPACFVVSLPQRAHAEA